MLYYYSPLYFKERNDYYMFNDIYVKINQKLMDTAYDSLSLEEKKQIISKKLIEYIKEKIDLFNKNKHRKLYSTNSNIYDFIDILSSLIPYDEQDSLNQLVHFILQIASGMQGFSITWYEEEREDFWELIEYGYKQLENFNFEEE